MVAADEGQPSQFPSSRNRTTPSWMPSSSTSPPWPRSVGRTCSSACAHARLQVERVQAVQQEQAAHHFVVGASVEDRPAGLARLVQVGEDALQAGAVQVEDGLHDLPAVRPATAGSAKSLHLPQQAVEPLQLAPGNSLRVERSVIIASVRRRAAASLTSATPNIGTCCTSSSLPSPRYMWTPHGRHGSKLRTARMMSMPLNLSGPFSSKIGVFCTASS